MIKLRDYLTKKVEPINESTILKNDENVLYKLIESPRNEEFILKSYGTSSKEQKRVVAVKNDLGITFKYNLDLDDLTTKLVDICDTLGFKFNTYIEKSKNVIEFNIYLY